MPAEPIGLNLDPRNLMTIFGVICSLAMLSIIYRENKIYRLFEHVFIGLAIGFGVGETWNLVLKPEWWAPVSDGKWWWMLTMLPAAMYYFIYSKKHNWISRVIIGFGFGLGVGGGFVGFIAGNVPQITASFKPITMAHAPYIHFSNLVFMVGFIATMTYFYFSIDHRHRSIAVSSRLGRWFIMIYLGAIFGTTVMGRMSILIERVTYMLRAFHVPIS
jgi:hypothetical protein